MVDPTAEGVSIELWNEATASCHELRVARVTPETEDAVSIVLEIPDALSQTFDYKAGQFLSFKIPYRGRILVRSYSLSSSPATDTEHKVTVKRIENGRISNWINKEVRAGKTLMVVPPAGRFVLDPDATRGVTLFGGGSGITPCISIIKTALAAGTRRLSLIYANQDRRSIIFDKELHALQKLHPENLEISDSLDDVDGYLTAEKVRGYVENRRGDDFYLCGPAAFMDTVEGTLLDLGIDRSRVYIERFISPPDHEDQAKDADAPESDSEAAPASITVTLDGEAREIPYQPGESILNAGKRAGLDPPFSCEEGYCSSCMAKLKEGRVVMAVNDCLTQNFLDEGWILTCQSRCVTPKIRIEYPD